MATAVKKISDTGSFALWSLAQNPDLRIATLRNGDRREWSARLAHRDHARIDVTVPVPVFRTLLKRELIAFAGSYVVSTNRFDGDLIHTEYSITDAGRAVVTAETVKTIMTGPTEHYIGWCPDCQDHRMFSQCIETPQAEGVCVYLCRTCGARVHELPPF